jgi:hypothetical protein
VVEPTAPLFSCTKPRVGAGRVDGEFGPHAKHTRPGKMIWNMNIIDGVMMQECVVHIDNEQRCSSDPHGQRLHVIHKQ